MDTFVRTSVEHSVASISLARPELHNAFNEVVIEQLTDAFIAAGNDENVRVVILRAEGKSFCAGADVHWMKRMVDYTFDENLKDAMSMARMLRTIRECPKPVIARVHGAAIGGGVGLLAACDMAAAVASVVFSLSEVKLGIIPSVISPFVLEKIGPGHARRFALTAERFQSDEAKRIGLICESVDSVEALDEWISTKVEQLKANGPHALSACKKILSKVAGVMWDDVQKCTARRIAELRVTPEGQDGLKAFLEKRSPSWVK